MSAEIVEFPIQPQGEIDPDDVLRSSVGRFKEVVVLGIGKDDLFYLASSTDNSPDILWIIKQGEYDVMGNAHRDDD